MDARKRSKMPFHKEHETSLSKGETDLQVLPQLKAKVEEMHRQVPSSTLILVTQELHSSVLPAPCAVIPSDPGIRARDKAADESVDLSCHFSCGHKRVIFLPSISSTWRDTKLSFISHWIFAWGDEGSRGS